MRKGKFYIIGIDGATWDVISPLIDSGVMPNLGKLLHEGIALPLNSTIPPVTAPAWASFMTGKNPGKHGVFEFPRFDPNTYRTSLNNASNIKSQTIWEILTKYDITSGVINVPMTYPPRHIKGFIVPGLMSPQFTNQELVTYPTELKDEILAKVPCYRVYLDDIPSKILARQGPVCYIEECIQLTQYRIELANFLTQRYNPELFMIHFIFSDSIQHFLWHYIDETYGIAGNPQIEEVRRKIHEYFRLVDSFLGQTLNYAGDSDYVMVLSDHGFGPIYKIFYLDQWMLENGLLKQRFTMERLIGWFKKLIKNVDRFGLRKRVRLQARGGYKVPQLAWEQTQAFSMPGGVFGYIRINRRGREAQGIVEEAEYEHLCKRLIDKLEHIKDPKTGDSVIKKVYRKEDLFNGPYTDQSPDLVLHPEPGYLIQKRLSNRIVTAVDIDKNITGSHRLNGIFAVKGPHFKRGVSGVEPSLLDIPPTILYLLDCPIPDDFDGRILTELITDDLLDQRKPRYEMTSAPEENQTEYTYDELEQEQIERRLRDLGYLE